MAKKTLRDVEVRGKRALVRVDFNVPLHPQTREVTDDSRLRACSNTIQHLRYYGAKVILCSHLGRPEGRVGEVLLLENLRFHPEEEANDPGFAQSLARLADLFVNDAFAAAHRAHASTVGITAYLPSMAGFLMEKEIEAL